MVDALVSNPSGRRTIIRNQISGESPLQGSTAALKQQTLATTRRRVKRKLKLSTIAVYASAFILLVAIVAIGYRPPQQASGIANTITTPTSSDDTTDTVDQPTVNDVVAANIASDVASAANLSIAPAVANLAVTAQVESELPQSDDTTIAKPQIVQLSSASRQITTYTAAPGDTVTSVAAKFNVSTDTIKDANNLTSDTLKAGQALQILPSNGIQYTVKSGDTIQSIADKYKADPSLITTYNDLDISGITTGLKIVIPNGVLPSDELPGYVAPVTAGYYYSNYATRYGYSSADFTIVNPANYIQSSVYDFNRATEVGNKNYNGQCTWYAWERRLAIGRPLPGIALGNASSWTYTLGASGYLVNSTPEVGAVIQNGGGAGHVGVVESINSDGSIVISEMNNIEAGGSYVVDLRTIPAYAVAYFNYIH